MTGKLGMVGTTVQRSDGLESIQRSIVDHGSFKFIDQALLWSFSTSVACDWWLERYGTSDSAIPGSIH